MIKEFKELDFDEVYSESNASAYRDEDLYFHMNNRITERVEEEK